MVEFEDDIQKQADETVIKYAFREGVKADKRKKSCRCAKCAAELENANDRVNWATEEGKWKYSMVKLSARGRKFWASHRQIEEEIDGGIEP